MFAYRDSTAMITGASKGLGAAFAKELAGRGMNLVLVARSIDALQDLADFLGAQYGVRCVVLQADLATSDAVKRIVTELGRLDLKIDLLINNAGLGLTGDFLSHDLAEELASIQVNVQALVGLSHALGAKMVSRGTGGIINLASNSAFQPLPHIGDLRGSEGVRSPLQRSAKIRTPGTRRPGNGCLPWADGDEFLRGCINQDEGRCVRQRRAGGPPYLEVVRSEKVRCLSWTVLRGRRHLASSSAAPQHHG
jgi:NAD(P)-dependent dehydrogenase (short-subunit alcohol dehydrogenase family)